MTYEDIRALGKHVSIICKNATKPNYFFQCLGIIGDKATKLLNDSEQKLLINGPIADKVHILNKIWFTTHIDYELFNMVCSKESLLDETGELTIIIKASELVDELRKSTKYYESTTLKERENEKWSIEVLDYITKSNYFDIKTKGGRKTLQFREITQMENAISSILNASKFSFSFIHIESDSDKEGGSYIQSIYKYLSMRGIPLSDALIIVPYQQRTYYFKAMMHGTTTLTFDEFRNSEKYYQPLKFKAIFVDKCHQYGVKEFYLLLDKINKLSTKEYVIFFGNKHIFPPSSVSFFLFNSFVNYFRVRPFLIAWNIFQKLYPGKVNQISGQLQKNFYRDSLIIQLIIIITAVQLKNVSTYCCFFFVWGLIKSILKKK